MKDVSVNINAYLHIAKARNGLTVSVPEENERNGEPHIFEKVSEDDTSFIDRAEAHYNAAIERQRTKLSAAKAEGAELFNALRNPEPETKTEEPA